MKQETIKAVTNRGKENEETAEQECDIPESLDEMRQLLGGDEAIFKLASAAYKVELQNKIRKPAARKITYLVDAFERLMPLVDSGTLTMEQARTASQYTGPWPIVEEAA